MRLRQGRFNSNYKGGCPTINILHRDEWEEAMKIEEDKLWNLLLKFNQQYLSGTYPSKIDVKVMYDKIIEARNKKAIE